MTRPPKKWARTVTTAQARYRFDGGDLIDGLDVVFVDANGVVLRSVRLEYLEPHAPTLSDVMTDLAAAVRHCARMTLILQAFGL